MLCVLGLITSQPMKFGAGVLVEGNENLLPWGFVFRKSRGYKTLLVLGEVFDFWSFQS